MNVQATRHMAQRVARKYMSKALRDQMQVSVSQTRVQLSELHEMVERGVALIDKSSHKEHTYKEAGDMISRFQTALEAMGTNVAELSYILNEMASTSAAQDLTPASRKELDRLLESRITQPEDLQGIPTFLENVPKAIEKTRADEESIYDVDRADDVAKRAPRPDTVDYSEFSTFVVKPDIKEDAVP